MSKKELLERKCLEAYTRDVGRGVVRMDYDTMDELKCSTGDTLHVIGNRSTVAKCLPLYPSDEKKGIIRIDGLVRSNAETAIGKQIKLLKATDVKRAEYVKVTPRETIPPVDERYLADAIESMVIIKGDGIMIPYFGGRLTFIIDEIKPEGVAIVTQKTVFKIDGLKENNKIKPKENRTMKQTLEEILETLQRMEKKL